MTLTMIVAILMIVAIVALLLKGVMNAGLIFAGVSVIGALIMGFGFGDLNGFLKAGMNTLGSTIFLMVFAILYFNILVEANIFKVMTRWVMKRVGNNAIVVSCVTNLLAMLSILSGSGAVSCVTTLPAMRPIYESMNMKNSSLMLVYTLGAGALIFMPWCIAVNEYSAYVSSDAMTMFNMLIPCVVFCVIASFVIAVLSGLRQMRHFKKLSEEEFAAMKAKIDEDTKVEIKNKGLMIFDTILTLVLIISLFTGLTNPQIIFAVGLIILLLTNYGSAKKQGEYLKSQGPRLINIIVTLLGLALYLGVANGTSAFNDLATFLTAGMSGDILIHLPLIVCLLCIPLQILLGNASPAIVVPTIGTLCVNAGLPVDPVAFMATYFAAHTVATNLCLFTPTPYLALELAGMDVKGQIKTQFFPCWIYSWAVTFFCVALGLIPL